MRTLRMFVSTPCGKIAKNYKSFKNFALTISENVLQSRKIYAIIASILFSCDTRAAYASFLTAKAGEFFPGTARNPAFRKNCRERRSSTIEWQPCQRNKGAGFTARLINRPPCQDKRTRTDGAQRNGAVRRRGVLRFCASFFHRRAGIDFIFQKEYRENLWRKN